MTRGYACSKALSRMPSRPISASAAMAAATSLTVRRRSDVPKVELTKTPSFRLDGKRALVTGGGRGIGLAAASVLASAGAHVTLAARTKSEIEQGAAAIRARGDKAEILVLDVTVIDAVRKAIAQAAPFQILVNNAGMNWPAYLPDVTI